jgi:hypothetical protein
MSNPPEPFRIELDIGNDESLEALLASLSEPAPAPTPCPPSPCAPPPAPAAEPAAAPARPLTRYEELLRTKGTTLDKGDLSVYAELSNLAAAVHCISRSIASLREHHPHLFSDRHYDTWIDSLKETHTTMLKEIHALRNGRLEKKYDKRFVCARCHAVFMVALPEDGLCDECRGAMTRRGGAY